jgi:hypothetical protein
VQVAGSRYYNPGIARWTSRDPIEEGGGASLFAFVGNSPAVWTDATGLQVGLPWQPPPSVSCGGPLGPPCPWGPPPQPPPRPPPGSCGGPFGPPCPWGPLPPSVLGPCPPGKKCRYPPPFGKCEFRTSVQAAIPVPNGCGPSGGPTLPGWWGGRGMWNFTPACNAHGICYGTCGSAKAACDSAFYAQMSSICNSFAFLPPLFIACRRQAASLYSAVALFGDGPYEDAQDLFCKWKACCP